MAPQTMALVTTLFPAHRIGAALGVWGAVAGLASVVGPLLGGFLVDSLGWEWIFLLNVPIGLAGLAMTVWLLPGGLPRNKHRFDVLGTVLSGLGLLALVFGLQNGQQYDWGTVAGPVTVPGLLAVGVLLLVAFAVRQHRTSRAGREPLMPPALFRQRNFSAAAVAAASVAFSLTGLFLPLMLFLQSVLELSPQQAGTLMIPTAIASGAVGPFAGVLSDRIGGKWVVLSGFLLFALGIGMLVVVMAPGASQWLLGVALFVCGLGTGASFAPLAQVATSGVPQELMGAASGAYNQLRQVGSVIGSAAVGVLLQAQISAREGLADAAATTLLLPVAVLLLGSAACLAMRSRVREGRQESTRDTKEMSDGRVG
jgi:EmrB/QacA subfamily drug resistance transporter